MLRRHPRGLLALRTGAPSGTVVVDIDPRHGGHDTLIELDRGGLLPGTVNVGTGSDGLHLYYRHPGGKVPCSASRLGPGVDVKADGGYVVLPPSRHPGTGGLYRWTGPDDVFTEPLTPLPVPLLERLKPPEPAPTRLFAAPAGTRRVSGSRRLAAILDRLAEAPNRERNFLLYWAARKVGEMHQQGDLADLAGPVAALQAVAQRLGLGDTEIGNEIKGTIGSGLRSRQEAA